jgi:hypothetical protein
MYAEGVKWIVAGGWRIGDDVDVAVSWAINFEADSGVDGARGN